MLDLLLKSVTNECLILALLLFGVATGGWGRHVLGSEEPEDPANPHCAILVRLDAAGRLQVQQSVDSRSPFQEADGLRIWSEDEQDRVTCFGKSGDDGGVQTAALRLRGVARSFATTRGTDSGIEVLTPQLDPLVEPDVSRAGTFLTPPNGRVLDGRVTIRRRPLQGESHTEASFPADTLVLQSGDVSVRIPLERGQQKIEFAQFGASLPSPWRHGLPQGTYLLRSEGGAESASFTVEPGAFRQRILMYTNTLAALLGTSADPLCVQLTVEQCLHPGANAKRHRQYLADALDAIERLPERLQTPSLQLQRRKILYLLGAGDAPLPSATDATGIAVIDRARVLIQDGFWSEARTDLQQARGAPDARCRALALLYQAMLEGEADFASQREKAVAPDESSVPRSLFQQALAALPQRSGADYYRAHYNYANYILRQSQDILYNQAFQTATGGQHPLLSALVNWCDAKSHYEQAASVASSADERSVAEIGLARLYALMADIVLALNGTAPASQMQALERAAIRQVSDHARRALDSGLTLPPSSLIPALAEELLAHCAYRTNDWAECFTRAQKAQSLYLHTGSLAGMESTYRLLGLAHWRAAAGATSNKTADSIPAQAKALQYLQIAHVLSEVLRERYPGDQMGRGRAGFFARRTYVTDLIVELLLLEGKDAQALQYAEGGKARAIQDLLLERGIHRPATQVTTFACGGALHDWPSTTAALEYFLGPEHAWVFRVGVHGNVKAYQLKRADGSPVPGPSLIAETHHFLQGMVLQAEQMRRQLEAGAGFDHHWQDTLYAFRQELLPGTVLDDLRDARTVIIVPAHILHYFPFAALVTEPDRRHTNANQIVQPRFLIDEKFNIAYAPSLTSWQLIRQDAPRVISEAAVVGIVHFDTLASLEGVAKDVDNMKAVFQERLRSVFVDAEATRSNAVATLHRPGVMLLATHGNNIPDSPLESFLVLQPSSSDEGHLTAADLFAESISSDIVIMNACFSGLADRSPLPGDDLFGLQRALLQGGARTVVAGLWDVYDGTGPQIIQGFLQRIAHGKDAASALADSQRAFLATLRQSSDAEPWLHPYFWAVFTVAGDDRSGEVSKHRSD